jgi:hypothetical protein
LNPLLAGYTKRCRIIKTRTALKGSMEGTWLKANK